MYIYMYFNAFDCAWLENTNCLKLFECKCETRTKLYERIIEIMRNCVNYKFLNQVFGLS